MSAEQETIDRILGPAPEYVESQSERHEAILKALDALPEQESEILRLRFGFEGAPWEIAAIGLKIGISRERVRHLEGMAISRLAALRELALAGALEP